MATVLNTLYPPSVQSSMPTFPYNKDVDLYFSISPYTNAKEIKYIHISIVSQKTNRSVLIAKDSKSNTCYPTVIMAKMPNTSINENSRSYKITIPRQVINSSNNDGWDFDCFYKVQLRFDLGGKDENGLDLIPEGSSAFPSWIFSNEDVAGRTNVDLAKNQIYLKNNQDKFSEWSSVCLLRPIPQCGLFYESGDTIKVSEWKPGIKGFLTEEVGQDIAFSPSEVEKYPSFTPGEILISTKLMFYAGNNAIATSEKLASYSIDVYDEAGIDLIIKGDTLYPVDISEDTRREIWTYLDISSLESGTTYNVYVLKINYTTTNGYTASLKQTFTVNQELDPSAFHITPILDDINGTIRLRILQDDVDPSSGHPKTYSDGTSNELFPGYLHVRRTSSKSRFKDWETMRVYSMGINEGEDAFIDFLFEDNTIESRTGYVYSVQYENIENNLYPMRRTDDPDSYGDVLMVDFNGPIFTFGEDQVRLEMDYQVNSIALNVNRSKIETLGSIYPKFVENGVYNYKTFSISGKISAQLDDGSLYTSTMKDLFELELEFYNLPQAEQEYYGDFEEYQKVMQPQYNTFINKKQLLGTKFLNYYYSTDTDGCYTKWDNWLEYNDWMWEREFREALLEWLNNGKPKLYRSLPEGNIAVILTDIQLSPVVELGRRLYDFSATMYEIGDGNSVENLDKLKIYDVIDSSEASYKANTSGSGQDVEHLQQLHNFTLKENLINGAGERNYELTKYIHDKTVYKYATDENNVLGMFFLNDDVPFSLRSIKLQFMNPPHLFKKEEPSSFDSLNIPVPIDPASKDFNEEWLKDSFYGYYVVTKILNDAGEMNFKGFYVNAQGYIQFPDDIKVAELYFPQMNRTGKYADIGKDNDKDTVNVDIIDMQYLACYKLSSIGDVVTNTNYSSFIVSQIIDSFKPNESVGDRIYRKYYSENRDETGKIIFKRYVDHWKGISLTTRPHTLITFTYNQDAGGDDVTYEIGHTGTLNMNYFFPCQDVVFSGMKFYHTDDTRYMDEYEYHRDNSASYKTISDIMNPQNQWTYYIEGQGWYIYWNGSFYRFIEGDADSTLNINDFIINQQDPNKTYLYWAENAEDEKYYNVPLKGSKKFDGTDTENAYYLWYENEWYDMSSLYNLIINDNNDIGVGLIPIDATLMYSGAIMKYNY